MVFVFFRDNPCFRNRMLVKQYPVEEDARKIRGGCFGLQFGWQFAPCAAWVGALGWQSVP